MDWTQAFTVIGVLGSFMFWQISKIDQDIKDIRNDMKQQGARTDRLYEMFIDLLKNKNSP